MYRWSSLHAAALFCKFHVFDSEAIHLDPIKFTYTSAQDSSTTYWSFCIGLAEDRPEQRVVVNS